MDKIGITIKNLDEFKKLLLTTTADIDELIKDLKFLNSFKIEPKIK